jgi:hypothetical protein
MTASVKGAINPRGIVPIPLYHHVAIATGDAHVYLAGQVAWDENGRLVADDLAGQVAQVYRNVAKGLAAVGATFHDLVRFTWYASTSCLRKGSWSKRRSPPSSINGICPHRPRAVPEWPPGTRARGGSAAA